MADTVVKKGNAAEKEMERRLVQQQLEKEKRDEEREKQKKEQAFQRDMDIRKTLSKQIEEKENMKKQQMEDNKKFIQMVLDQDQSYNNA